MSTPKTCSNCPHMGPYGHGEPPDCKHPKKGRPGPYEFANPRSEPPQWCPLRRESMSELPPLPEPRWMWRVSASRPYEDSFSASQMRAYAAAAVAAKWKPIETAPRGHKEVLLFAPTESPPVFTGMLICNEWCRSSSGNYSPNDDFFGDGKIDATHWMPLPDVPRSANEGAPSGEHGTSMRNTSEPSG